MNLTQLTAFREVMKSASLSQAARNLNRSQPAVSLAIKSLEESLGLKLFQREGRQMVPVPEAHYLFDEAEEIIGRLEGITGTMQALSEARTGHLNLATMPGPASHLMPEFLSREIGPQAGGAAGITVSLATRTSPQIRQLAGSQSIDFGFGDFQEGTGNARLFDEDVIPAQCLCALPVNHPLAARDRLSLADLDGERFGVLSGGHPLTTRVTAALEAAGAQCPQVVQCQFFVPLLHFVAAGQCLSLVDPLTAVTEAAIHKGPPRVVFRPLIEPIAYSYAIYTPVHRPLSRLAERFRAGWRAQVCDHLRELGAGG
ncbi:DNA-binding transcriptional regulator, LysR family [Pseudooceanicola antarcticus]|uniref:DNA-binding transcriptional regulator, LysR family n=1 Tax=Pseudooceanicola antarcticus TaxID=1247613 RepID=A0A285J5P1_9RHOB|nr:LysR family transcriptional regulator [Pseudooceanicola antarcticus]PJE26855.1 LysR family transcriptional regulator [Pseudooceanicola antarcticus]SNY55528.1 DNA-binding transcriptional regulator, LysR family [Pseudooceanicola antarcticus]